MTSNLKELPWFEEVWATDLRNAVRVLVRDYAEAVELVERISKPIQRVTYHDKLGRDHSVWVVKSLLIREVSLASPRMCSVTASLSPSTITVFDSPTSNTSRFSESILALLFNEESAS